MFQKCIEGYLSVREYLMKAKQQTKPYVSFSYLLLHYYEFCSFMTMTMYVWYLSELVTCFVGKLNERFLCQYIHLSITL